MEWWLEILSALNCSRKSQDLRHIPVEQFSTSEHIKLVSKFCYPDLWWSLYLWHLITSPFDDDIFFPTHDMLLLRPTSKSRQQRHHLVDRHGESLASRFISGMLAPRRPSVFPSLRSSSSSSDGNLGRGRSLCA